MSATPRIKSRKGSAADEVARLLAKRNGTLPKSNGPASIPSVSGGLRFDVMGRLLAQKRAKENLSLRDVGRETGISTTTLMRMEHGRVSDTDNVIALSQWLGLTVERLTGPVVESVPQQIKAIILADPRLSDEAGEALCSMFSVLYQQMTKDSASEGEL